jgi:hypothetical protein
MSMITLDSPPKNLREILLREATTPRTNEPPRRSACSVTVLANDAGKVSATCHEGASIRQCVTFDKAAPSESGDSRSNANDLARAVARLYDAQESAQLNAKPRAEPARMDVHVIVRDVGAGRGALLFIG